MKFPDYLQLLDWSGRRRASGKRGAIEQDLPPILARLQIDPNAWLRTMRPGGNRFGRAIGRFERMRAHAARLGQSWIRGLQVALEVTAGVVSLPGSNLEVRIHSNRLTTDRSQSICELPSPCTVEQ